MHSMVKPNAWVVLRLPSDTLKVLQIIPNRYISTTLPVPFLLLTFASIISLGKYGSFSSNYLLSRPYHQTYELLDRVPGSSSSGLRIVPASELHADTIAEEASSSTPSNPTSIIDAGDGVEFQLVGENGEVVMRSNRETIDDSARQTLTMEEIEELKREGTGAGKDLIAKLMLSHTGIEQKTAFSLAKYKLLKTKKYLRRFTLLPLDVAMLCHWMVEEKGAGKILEFREELLALAGSWSNVHYASESSTTPGFGGGRWLVVDETGGLLVAAMAERMGILYPEDNVSDETIDPDQEVPSTRGREFDHSFESSNTLTLLHTNAQPNLSLLTYFHYNPNAPSLTSSHTHPLATHLLPLSWLQLISPHLDSTYSSPPPIYTLEERQEMKSGKRGTYYRKLRRYNRTKHIVDSTLAGNFDGLAIASSMSPESILRHTIPLLRGGAPIVIYSPTIEPLVQLADVYSTSRRTAFIQSPPASFQALTTEDQKARWKGNEDFPLNPTLVLNASVQSARVREWQVLPGRTHPLMTGKGGAEGYLFTGVRVRPAEGRVEARGKFVRKKEKPVEAKSGDGKVDVSKNQNGGDVEEKIDMDTLKNQNGEDVEMAGS
jgi:tRNA (adenine-N(1)-)-methyltransferase non-catalytic subunit